MNNPSAYAYADQLRQSYLRYLKAAHPIHTAEEELQRMFDNAASQRDQFVREPLISTIPSYRQGEAPQDLFSRSAAPSFTDRMKNLAPEQFAPQRPLYAHQLTAIERIQTGRNTVVATGTGSGKTECFLLPILDDILRNPEPGVRAVLVYPMNALANDQLERLRLLVGDTPITFGRYTGQTPWTEEGVDQTLLQQVKRPNELFTREEIRQQPPHILLTNFAMLEYLLLRPHDDVLFHGERLRYVVLDEAHTYSGAQGIDIGLLMRRLQGRCPQPLRFVLTSATLGSGQSDKVREEIAGFAGKLTGGVFRGDDVVFGDTASAFLTDPQHEIRPETFATEDDGLLEALENTTLMRSWLSQRGMPCAEGSDGADLLFRSLRQCQVVKRLYELLEQQPRTVDELCRLVGGDADEASREAMYRLLTVIGYARSHTDGRPFMPIRLHHFFRGLSGVSLDLLPGANPPVQALFLEDRPTSSDGLRHLVELRSCAHCGMPVVAVEVLPDGTWRKPSRAGGGSFRMLTWMDPDAFAWSDDEAEEAESATEAVSAYLDLISRQYGEGPHGRLEGPDVVELRILGIGQKKILETGNLSRCPCCGGTATPYPSVLREFRTGADAPTALLAEEMVRLAPPMDPGDEDQARLPAGGRRLLAFSDSRQRAAHFTSYLTWTSAEPSFVQPLLCAAEKLDREQQRSPTVREVVEAATDMAQASPWLVTRETDDDGFERYQVVPSAQATPEDRRRLQRELALTVYRHISAAMLQRTKLGGLMLLSPMIEIEPGEWDQAAQRLPDLFREESVAHDLVQRLLLYMVRRLAIDFWPSVLTPRHLLPDGQGPQQVVFHRNPVGGDRGGIRRIRWNPSHAPDRSRKQATRLSRTASAVRAALRGLGKESAETVDATLEGLWEWLTADAQILRHAGEGSYQLPASRIQLSAADGWHRCRRCGTPTRFRMTGVCETYGCGGQLQPVQAAQRQTHLAENHRVRRYRRAPLPLVVREHTAQLDLDHGREYQHQFMRGRVNVLSSSTTFEMGVDVGQLESVLLRNVPPTPANYVQRAGRAGRRLQGVAHAVTFARTLPHDQHHYFQPVDIVNGRVPVPVLYTANEPLTQRHVNSLLLGLFLKNLHDSSGTDRLTIEQFFPIAKVDEDAPVQGFAGWCQERHGELLEAVTRVIPEDCGLDPTVAINTAGRTLFLIDPEATETVYHRGLRTPLTAYEKEDQEHQQAMMELMKDPNKMHQIQGIAGARRSIDNLRKQLLRTRLIDFLSLHCWLPSYAFPQNVVPLTVRQATESGRMNLTRDREMGISEYAPGSEVIADGKLFASAGINLEKREPDLKWFLTDRATRRVTIDRQRENLQGQGRPMEFIQPTGFTTRWDAPVTIPNLFRRTPPSNTEVFILEGAETFVPAEQLAGVSVGVRKGATLFRANLGHGGRGFRICRRCGLGFADGVRNAAGAHTTPWGSRCTGKPQPVALAHVSHADVIAVRFPGFTTTPMIDNRAFWTSLAAAVAQGACERLAIAPADLEVTYRSQSGSDLQGELVFYDRIPGGAGHVFRIQQHLDEIFAAACQLVTQCLNPNCDPNASCYSCLRSHRNQFDWDHLQRESIRDWLEHLTLEQAAAALSR